MTNQPLSKLEEVDGILNAYLSDRYDVALPSKKAYLLKLATTQINTLIANAVIEARLDEVDKLPLKFDTEVNGTNYRVYGYSSKGKKARIANLKQEG